jgi:hypothetical protein
MLWSRVRTKFSSVAFGWPMAMVRMARTSSIRIRSIGAGQVIFTPGLTVRE